MDSPALRRLIEMALEEDIGPGDITTLPLISPDQTGLAKIVAKESMILAGLFVVRKVFSMLDAGIRVRSSRKEGESVQVGSVVLEADGNLRALLTGERTALNFLQRLCGIATHVSDYMKVVKGTQ